MTGLVVDNLNIDMRPLDIPGYVNSAHMEDLARTVDSLSDVARILEIGCGYGRSTVCTLNHMKPTQTLTVVDTFIHLKPSKIIKSIQKHHKREGKKINKILSENIRVLNQKGQRGLFDHVLQQHPLQHTVTVHQMSSKQYIAENPLDTYDAVYIDGEHTYDAVMMELDHFQNTITLMGDDYGPAHPGVTRAIDVIRKRYPDRAWYPPRLQLKSGFWCIERV